MKPLVINKHFLYFYSRTKWNFIDWTTAIHILFTHLFAVSTCCCYITTITLWQWHCHSAKSELYQKSYTVTGWQFKVWNITLRHSVGHKPTIRRSAKVSTEYSRVYKEKGYTLLYNGEWPFLYLRVHYPSKQIMCIWPLLYLSALICLERSV